MSIEGLGTADAALVPVVATVGDDGLVRRVEGVLGRHGIEVVASAAAAEDLRELSDVCHPHVVVMTGGAGHGPTAAAMRTLRGFLPRSRVVLVVDDHDASTVRGALRAGADGVVVEHELASSLPVVVRAVSLGHAVVPLRDRTALGRQPLSGREREILALAADGLTNAMIGAELQLAPSTVKTHLSSGCSKLGVRSRAELPAVIGGRAA